MTRISAAWVFIALLAAPSAADDLTGFQACIGPELDARARLIAAADPCSLTRSCQTDPATDPSPWHLQAEVQCAASQMEACALSEDVTACYEGFAALLTDLRQDIAAAIPEGRLDPLTMLEGGDTLGDGRAAALTAPEPPACPAGLSATERQMDLPEGTICVAFAAFANWNTAKTFEDRVERLEQQLADEGGADK